MPSFLLQGMSSTINSFNTENICRLIPDFTDYEKLMCDEIMYN